MSKTQNKEMKQLIESCVKDLQDNLRISRSQALQAFEIISKRLLPFTMKRITSK